MPSNMEYADACSKNANPWHMLSEASADYLLTVSRAIQLGTCVFLYNSFQQASTNFHPVEARITVKSFLHSLFRSLKKRFQFYPHLLTVIVWHLRSLVVNMSGLKESWKVSIGHGEQICQSMAQKTSWISEGYKSKREFLPPKSFYFPFCTETEKGKEIASNLKKLILWCCPLIYKMTVWKS